jgi:hypothetical protein
MAKKFRDLVQCLPHDRFVKIWKETNCLQCRIVAGDESLMIYYGHEDFYWFQAKQRHALVQMDDQITLLAFPKTHTWFGRSGTLRVKLFTTTPYTFEQLSSGEFVHQLSVNTQLNDRLLFHETGMFARLLCGTYTPLPKDLPSQCCKITHTYLVTKNRSDEVQITQRYFVGEGRGIISTLVFPTFLRGVHKANMLDSERSIQRTPPEVVNAYHW